METGRAKCTVHFLPARAGDCLVLELDNKNCILIDCGYPSTYREELKPLLQKLAKDGCRISLMILTHIDEDHISGAISFIEENGDAENPQIIQVDEIWHNGIFNTVLQSELFLKHKREKVPKGQPEKYRRTRGLLKKQLHGKLKRQMGRKTYKGLRDDEELNRFLKCAVSFEKCKVGFDSCMISWLMKYKELIAEESIDYCEAGRFSAFISEKGIMYPCSFLCGNRVNGENVREKKLVEIWKNGTAFQEMRSRLTKPAQQNVPILKCAGCTDYRLCHGGCQEFTINRCG